MHQVVFGGLLAIVIALGAYSAGALTVSGAISAGVIGTVIFGVGGWRWGMALVIFFVTSSALSRWRRRTKEALGFEKGGRRDAGQVWANGGMATVCALLTLLPEYPSRQAYVLFLAALAAANADTWATEIGAALGGRPYDLRTLRPVRPGTSGAVSVAGTAAALAGALLLALFAGPLWCPVALSGLLGSLGDSLLGATVQAQWPDSDDPERLTERGPDREIPPIRGIAGVGNDLVNLLGTLLGVLICAFLLALQRPS